MCSKGSAYIALIEEYENQMQVETVESVLQLGVKGQSQFRHMQHPKYQHSHQKKKGEWLQPTREKQLGIYKFKSIK